MLCICLYQFVSLQFGNKKLIHIFVSLSKCSNFKFNVNVRERWYRFSSATIFLSLSRQSRKKKKEKNTGSCFFPSGIWQERGRRHQTLKTSNTISGLWMTLKGKKMVQRLLLLLNVVESKINNTFHIRCRLGVEFENNYFLKPGLFLFVFVLFKLSCTNFTEKLFSVIWSRRRARLHLITITATNQFLQ